MTEPSGTQASGAERAASSIAASGVPYDVTSHGPVASLAEAAAARGLEPAQILKTIVVRRAADDFLLVLVPGDRAISWPKLRALLGINRVSMPDAETARTATGYERGTITPFGSTTAWPVVADERIAVAGPVSVGGGAHGVAFTLTGPDLLTALATLAGGVQQADVTDAL